MFRVSVGVRLVDFCGEGRTVEGWGRVDGEDLVL